MPVGQHAPALRTLCIFATGSLVVLRAFSQPSRGCWGTRGTGRAFCEACKMRTEHALYTLSMAGLGCEAISRSGIGICLVP